MVFSPSSRFSVGAQVVVLYRSCSAEDNRVTQDTQVGFRAHADIFGGLYGAPESKQDQPHAK